MTTAGLTTSTRVNLGCGLDAVDGWLNIFRAHEVEWPDTVQRHDGTAGVPLASAAEAMYSSYSLNSFPFERPGRCDLPARLLGSSGSHTWRSTPALVEHRAVSFFLEAR